MVNSQSNLLDVQSRQADTDPLRQDVSNYKKQLALVLEEKEALCQTCEDQAALITEMKSRLNEIRDWKIQAERCLKQLSLQEQNDPDLLLKNEEFIEQYQALQDLNEQLYQEKEELVDALHRAHEKIRKLEESSELQRENQRLTDALNQQIEVSQKKINQLQQALVEKQRLLSIANNTKQVDPAIEQQHAATANEIAGLRLQLETKTSELGKVTAELQTARQSQQSLQQALVEKERLLSIANSIKQADQVIEQQRAAIANENAGLKLQLETKTSELEKVTAQLQAARQSHQSLQQEYQKQKNFIEQLQSQQSTPQTQPAALTGEAGQLQQERDAALQRIEALEQSLNQERAILNITQKEMQKYHKMTSDLQEKICQMNAERAQLKNAEWQAQQEPTKMNGQTNSVNTPTNTAFPTPGMIRTQESMQQLQEELQRRKDHGQPNTLPDSNDLISSIASQQNTL